MSYYIKGEKDPYPSKEWYEASQKMRGRGETVTSSGVNKERAGVGGTTVTDLEGTLAKAKKETPKALPTGGIDSFTAMNIMMRDIAGRAKKRRMKTGMEAVTGGLDEMGFDRSKMSGSVTRGIIDFVARQTAPAIDRQFDNMADIIKSLSTQQDKIKSDAKSTIQMMMSSKIWNSATDEQRKILWEQAGMPGNPLTVPLDTEDQEDIRKDIVDDVYRSRSAYRDSSEEGWREDLIGVMVATYGPEWEGYIKKQVYVLLPDDLTVETTTYDDLKADEQSLVNVIQHRIDSEYSDEESELDYSDYEAVVKAFPQYAHLLKPAKMGDMDERDFQTWKQEQDK